MGLGSAVLSAFVALAWPRRSRNSTVTPFNSSAAPLSKSGANLLELADWSPSSGVESGAGSLKVEQATQERPNPWLTVVSAPELALSETRVVPIDSSARAYFEWRMALDLTDNDEERVIYQDYLDQCAFGKYEPISLIMFGKGLVACGCTKMQIKVELEDGKIRRPNWIKWPMQLGMQ